MTNYLNQIESDLYKLNSITNGSGEVVEMVAELKEKYRKAKAFDEIHEVKIKAIEECNYLISPKFFKMFGMKAFRKLEEIEEEYESGESDA